MAWAERLPSGRYRGVYRDRAGRRHSLPHTYEQPAEAKRAAAIKEDEIRRRPVAQKRAARMTWGEWCDEWIELRRTGSRKIRRVEPGTLGRDISRIERHIRPQWGDVPLGDIDRAAVVEWIDRLQTRTLAGNEGRTLAPRTVAKIVSVFSASMRDAVVTEKIDSSPCTLLVEMNPAEPADEYFLTPEEFGRLVEHADELTRFVAELGAGTGMRWGELAGLHRERVDTAHLRVLVQEVYDKATDEIKPYPKGKQRRGVPITAELATKIDAWMEAHPPVPCRTRHRGGKHCGGSLLIPSRAGTVLAYNNFRRRHWDAAVKAAGLTGVTPHDLRHTYASWLIQSKHVTIDEVGALLGHKDRATTQRYAHFGEGHWDDARKVLGTIDQTPDEDSLRAAIARLAAEKPGEWAAVAAALGGDSGTAAPDLPHEGDHQKGGKIIRLDRFRRPAG